jgi:hypothetical protein
MDLPCRSRASADEAERDGKNTGTDIARNDGVGALVADAFGL